MRTIQWSFDLVPSSLAGREIQHIAYIEEAIVKANRHVEPSTKRRVEEVIEERATAIARRVRGMLATTGQCHSF